MYIPNITMAGGVPVFVPLRVDPKIDQSKKFSSNDWILDMNELRG